MVWIQVEQSPEKNSLCIDAKIRFPTIRNRALWDWSNLDDDDDDDDEWFLWYY